MLKKILLVCVVALALMGCNNSMKNIISKTEYETVVAERDKYKKDYELILEDYANLKVKEKIETVSIVDYESVKEERDYYKSLYKTKEVTGLDNTNVLIDELKDEPLIYEDDIVKITFLYTTTEASVGCNYKCNGGLIIRVVNKGYVGIKLQNDVIALDGVTKEFCYNVIKCPQKSTTLACLCTEDGLANLFPSMITGKIQIVDDDYIFGDTNEAFKSYYAKFTEVKLD